MTEEAPARFGSKEFKSNGPISILAADGNRYQLDDATNEYFGEIEKALREFDDKDDKKNNIQQRRDDGEEGAQATKRSDRNISKQRAGRRGWERGGVDDGRAVFAVDRETGRARDG